MQQVRKSVIQTFKRYNIQLKNETIVLAVSGGVDSMVLFDLMLKFKKTENCQLVVAHVNHNKRQQADAEQKLVTYMAQAHRIPCETMLLENNENKDNFHAYARQKRYDFFKAVATLYKAKIIMTAHHADDHLETVIGRLLSHEKPSSLVGILPESDYEGFKLMRPLIEIKKADLIAYAVDENIMWLEDDSNQSFVYTRNRIRQQIIPQLRKENESIYGHVRQMSDHLCEDEHYFQQEVEKAFQKIRCVSGGFEGEKEWLMFLPESIKRRLLERIHPAISKGAYENFKAFLKEHHPNGFMDLGDEWTFSFRYDLFRLVKGKHKEEKSFCQKLTLNDEIVLPNGKKIKMSDGKAEKNEKKVTDFIYLCYNDIQLPLYVRNRNPGDRIALSKQLGHSKVNRIMIDNKIPLEERDQWPIVTDAVGTIIWIPQLKKTEICKRRSESKNDFLVTMM